MPPASSEQNFRANLSQFRWARGNTDDSQPAAQPAQGGNPFSRFYNAVAGDYIPLRSSEQSNEEEAWFALSRWERCVPQTVKYILANTRNFFVKITGFRRMFDRRRYLFLRLVHDTAVPCHKVGQTCFIPIVHHISYFQRRPAKFALSFRCSKFPACTSRPIT